MHASLRENKSAQSLSYTRLVKISWCSRACVCMYMSMCVCVCVCVCVCSHSFLYAFISCLSRRNFSHSKPLGMPVMEFLDQGN